jgi:hypothetical protein
MLGFWCDIITFCSSFNEESSFSLNETLLQEFGSVNTDEEIDKLFQMIGKAAFHLLSFFAALNFKSLS